MDKGKGLVDLLQSAVDGGVQAVRQVHVTMIKESCDTIQALLGEPKAAKIIGEVQIAGSTVVYEAIRLVNRTVGTLAKAALLSPRMVVPLEEDSINTNTPDTAEPPLPQKPHPLLPILNGIVG
ncbi:hypothetical protein KJ865_06095, partial [Myxococcota bacterium]|nr:hypothetical protein [Myxococcota bacterium]